MNNELKYNELGKKNTVNVIEKETQSSVGFSLCFDAPADGESCPSAGIFYVKIANRHIRNASAAQCKALAVHSIIRANETRTGKRTDTYLVSDIHKLTGLHANTVKKVLPVLAEMKLVETTPDGRIRLLRAKSRNSTKNMIIPVDTLENTFNETYHEILRARVVNKLRQMHYYDDAAQKLADILSSEHKGTCKEIKELRKQTVEHRRQQCDDGSEQTFGISYARLSEYLGVSMKLTQQIVKSLVECGVIEKKQRFERKKITDDADLYFNEYTFTFKGYMYKIYANEYGIKKDVYSKK